MTGVYMKKQCLAFIKAWPDIPEVLIPILPRFLYRGLASGEFNGKNASGLELTERGARLKALADGQSFNFFTESQIQEILPDGDSPARLDNIFEDPIQPMFVQTPQEAGYLYIKERAAGLRAAMIGLEIACEGLTDACSAARRTKRVKETESVAERRLSFALAGLGDAVYAARMGL